MKPWLPLTLLWFAAAVYALIFRESDGTPPPFLHADKFVHAALFFGQFWLWAKIYLAEGRRPPRAAAAVAAVFLAVSSEWAQAVFTQTRSGDWADAAADCIGAAAALWLADKVAAAREKRADMPCQSKDAGI